MDNHPLIFEFGDDIVDGCDPSSRRGKRDGKTDRKGGEER